MSNARALYLGILLTGFMAVFALFARLQIIVGNLARPRSGNIFFRLYALHEQPFLLLLAGAAVAAYVVVRTRRRSAEAAALPPAPEAASRRLLPSTASLAVVALLVLVGTFAVAQLVLHGLAFSMDEFSADFQARLFAAGQYQAALPGPWRPYAAAIIPIFVQYRGESASWLSVYLPVYALLKAPFVALGAPTLLNPVLAALSVLALGGVARRLWPNEVARPWLAVAFLVASSQFIVTSGTAYSMPAHLCLNLIWLWLYLRDDRWSWAAALGVGVLALGLHSPFPHGLFVAPFLLRLLRDRRWERLASAFVVYVAGAVMWLAWLRMSQPLAHNGAGGLLAAFAAPSWRAIWVHAINLSLLFTWQTPILGLLVLVAVLRANRLGKPLADLAWGVALTLIFFTFFPSTQGHGWGYRYAYQLLGSLALLGAAGLEPLREVVGRRRTQLLVAGSFLLTLGLELPLRLVQTERFVRPFAAGVAYVMSRNADVVLIRGDSVWYGRDLLRNDPFLRGQPVVVQAGVLTEEGRALLYRGFPGRVVEVSDAELIKLGMTPWLHAPGEY